MRYPASVIYFTTEGSSIGCLTDCAKFTMHIMRRVNADYIDFEGKLKVLEKEDKKQNGKPGEVRLLKL